MGKQVWFVAAVIVAVFALNAFAQVKPELDPSKPRIPPDKLAAAKALKPPFAMTPAVVEEGKALFIGKATCFVCHGNEGKGDGPGAVGTAVGPRNFTNAAFEKEVTCGEMFWVAANGSKGFYTGGKASNPDGTGMVPYLMNHDSELGLVGTPVVDENELWKVIFFERSLAGGKC